LKADQEIFHISYSLQKGKERMRLHIKGREIHVNLERRKDHHYWIRIDRQVIKVWGIADRSEILIDLDGHLFTFRRMDILDRRYIRLDERKLKEIPGEISAPLNGRVVQVNVKAGDQVSKGDPLLVIESMKMENKILSDFPAVVKQIGVSVGQQVHTNQILLTLASI
jgi:acetyl/propionyl-CoA carboxylase alpha subunit